MVLRNFYLPSKRGTGARKRGAGAILATPKPRAKFGAHSEPENLLAFQLDAARIPFERQYRIHPERRFRADFWLPAPQCVVEIDGGIWTAGRHSRGAGITRDCEKSAYIALMPARLLRVTPDQVKSGRALDWILALHAAL